MRVLAVLFAVLLGQQATACTMQRFITVEDVRKADFIFEGNLIAIDGFELTFEVTNELYGENQNPESEPLTVSTLIMEHSTLVLPTHLPTELSFQTYLLAVRWPDYDLLDPEVRSDLEPNPLLIGDFCSRPFLVPLGYEGSYGIRSEAQMRALIAEAFP